LNNKVEELIRHVQREPQFTAKSLTESSVICFSEAKLHVEKYFDF